MEFLFAKDHDEARRIHEEWWLSLTPAERWRSNWAHVEFLKKFRPDLCNLPTDKYILK